MWPWIVGATLGGAWGTGWSVVAYNAGEKRGRADAAAQYAARPEPEHVTPLELHKPEPWVKPWPAAHGDEINHICSPTCPGWKP